MKLHVPSSLHLEDIKPYMTGENVLEYTNSDSEDQPLDIFVGEVSKITCKENNGVVSAVTINMKWIVRLRKPLEADDPPEYYEPVENSRQVNSSLTFELPQLVKKRSPLTLKSARATIKISHVTKLAKVVIGIENARNLRQ